MIGVSYPLLERLCERVIEIAGRRAGDSPAVAAFAPIIIESGTAFRDAYRAQKNYEVNYKSERNESQAAIEAMRQIMLSWAPVLKEAIFGFNIKQYLPSSMVADDLINGAEALHDLITDYRDAQGAPLPFQAQLLGLLDPALQVLLKEAPEAVVANKEYQRLQAAKQETAEAFYKKLIAFRRIMTVAFGRSDRDVQRLRVSRAQSEPEADGQTPPPAQPPAAS